MAVIVNVSFAEVLMLSVLVRQMGVGDCRVIVLVQVERRQVLPLAHELVRAFTPVMRDVRVLVGVDHGLVRVLHVVLEVGGGGAPAGEAARAGGKGGGAGGAQRP